jgi:LacI family repressor for deo operon, udp, cdd, tsx, nupC, and nupG
MNNKATYQRIAAETGISVATVSRIFTGASNVKAETRQKVLTFLEASGYDTSLIHARENAQSNRLLILNVPSIGNPFYTQILHGAKTAALQRGCHLFLNEDHINDSTIGHFLDVLHKIHAAGLIITNHVPAPLLKRLSEEIPLVQCCEYDSSFDIPYVSIDDVAAAKTGMEYLFSLGRKNIAFINGPIRYKYAKFRLKGYRDSLAAANIPFDPELVLQLPEISYDLAISAVNNLFDSGKRPNAFFCASDVLAAAVIKAALRRGFSVPEDIAVVGFDNVDISFMSTPTITTISQPEYQLGLSSCELLVERLTNPETPISNILLATELIVRESSTLPTALLNV